MSQNSPFDQFVKVCVESAVEARKDGSDPTLALRLSLGRMLDAEKLVQAGFDPVSNFQLIAQGILQDPNGQQLGEAFLYFYAGLYDSPSPAHLPLRAARIYNGALRLANHKIYGVSALAAQFAADGYAQCGLGTSQLTAQILSYRMTYAGIPWWPKWNTQAGQFSRWKLFKFITKNFARKVLWAAWGYGTAYWTSGLRTFIVGLVPGLFASLVYTAYGMRANGHATHSLVTALYLSGVTLTTLGYGDVTPMGLARGFAVIESAYGMLLFAFVIVLFVRRYIR